MSILQKQRARDPEAGYARDFVSQLAPLLGAIRERGITVITNAGGVNPGACARAVLRAATEAGVALTVAVVDGDDLMGRLDALLDDGVGFDNLETGDPFGPRRAGVLSANAYFGAEPIVRALAHRPDVVVTGRVTDTGITLAPIRHAFGWDPHDWDRIAGGIVAGHLIECGVQATGGNFTDWERVPGLGNEGFPVVEVEEDGAFVLTKQSGTGWPGLPRRRPGTTALRDGRPGALPVPGCDRGLLRSHGGRCRGGPGARAGGAGRSASGRPQGERVGPGRLQRPRQPGGRGSRCPGEDGRARDGFPGSAAGRLRGRGRSVPGRVPRGPRGRGRRAARAGRPLAPRSVRGPRPLRRLEPGPGAAAGLPQAAPQLHPQRPRRTRGHRRRPGDLRGGRLLAGARPPGPGPGLRPRDPGFRRRNRNGGRRGNGAFRGADRSGERAVGGRQALADRGPGSGPPDRDAPRRGGARPQRRQGRRGQHRDRREEHRLLRVAPWAPDRGARRRMGAGRRRGSDRPLRGTRTLGLNFILERALGGGGTRSLLLDPQGKTLAQGVLRRRVRIPAALLSTIPAEDRPLSPTFAAPFSVS